MANTFTSQFTGNLVRDPETPHEAILKFTVANNYRTQQDGEWTEEANFIDCVVFGKRAAGLAKILQKGMKVAVDARLETDRWTNKDGENRQRFQWVAREVEILTPKGEGPARSDLPEATMPATSGAVTAGDSDIPF